MTVVGRLDTMRATSASSRRNAAGAQSSNCCEYLRTASSPLERMSASTAATVSTTCALLVFDVPASAAGAFSVFDTVYLLALLGIERRRRLPADVPPVSAPGYRVDRYIMCSDEPDSCTLMPRCGWKPPGVEPPPHRR